MDKGVMKDFDHMTSMNECELDETSAYCQIFI